MSSARGASASPRSQRRRAEIVDAASALFAQLGYHRVGIDDVAAAVGITGGAIYKHFGGKQDLLAHAIDGALTPVEAAVAAAPDLRTAVLGLAALATDQRRNGVLLTREVRALDGAPAEDLRRRIDDVRAAIAAHVAHAADRTPLDARLLADAVLALMCSTAHHTIVLPRHQSIGLLAALSEQTAALELPPPSANGRTDGTGGHRRAASLVDRRDQLIAAAIDLFGRRGYWAATMGDVGAAADIAGPSIYQHFSSKADLLVAALTRGNEGLRLGLTRALAEGADPAGTLELLVSSYVDLVLAHSGLIDLLMHEALYLPELELRSVRGMQTRYVGEWVSLVQATHPGLEQRTARFIVHAVLSVVNNRGPRRPDDGTRLHEVLVPIAIDLLLAPGWAEVAP